MKTCGKCEIKKELSEFNKNKHVESGLRSVCRECDKQYYLSNKEKQKTYKKKYYLDNLEVSKQYYIDNKEHRKQHYLDNKEQKKQYYLENKENKKIYNKQYYLDNKEKRKIYNKEYSKQRRLDDPLFKLVSNIRNLIRTCMKTSGYSKTSKTYQILGCPYEEFKSHLENQFTEGMTWENQGQWHMDHIYPVSLATDQDHIIKLNHYTNFQPMWAVDNIKKGNKIQ